MKGGGPPTKGIIVVSRREARGNYGPSSRGTEVSRGASGEKKLPEMKEKDLVVCEGKKSVKRGGKCHALSFFKNCDERGDSSTWSGKKMKEGERTRL